MGRWSAQACRLQIRSNMTVDAKDKKREPIVFPAHLKDNGTSTGPARPVKRAWPEEKYNVKLPTAFLEDPHTHRFKRNKSASSNEAKAPEKAVEAKPVAARVPSPVSGLASSRGTQQVPRTAKGSNAGKKHGFQKPVSQSQKQKARQDASTRGNHGQQHRVITKQKGHHQGASPLGRSRKPHQGVVQAKAGHALPSQPKGRGRQKEKADSAGHGDLDLNKRLNLSLDDLAKLNKKKGKAAVGSGKGH